MEQGRAIGILMNPNPIRSIFEMIQQMICCLPIFIGLQRCQAQALSEVDLAKIWMTHSAALREIANTVNLSDSRKEDLKRWLDGGGETISDREEMLRFLATLNDLGVESAIGKERTGWIERPLIVRLLAEGLRAKDFEVRTRSIYYLSNFARDKDLATVSLKLLEDLGHDTGRDSIRLLARLELPVLKKQAIMKSPHDVPGEIMARLGDTNRFLEIREQFLRASTYEAKRVFAYKLGYIGGFGAANALASQLSSKLVSRGPTDLISIRVEILRALGRIYQDEPLLNRELLKRIDLTDIDPDETLSYLKSVTQWLENSLGTRVSIDVPSPNEPILIRHFIVERPIRPKQ